METKASNIEWIKGNHSFHEDPNFNYQMNRWARLGHLDVTEMKSAAGKIKTLADHNRILLEWAEREEDQGKILQAAFLYRAVDFFLPYCDPRKKAINRKAIGLIRSCYAEYFETGRIEEHRVPFQEGNLPMWILRGQGNPSGLILFNGGFDSIKEDLIPVLVHLSDYGFNVCFFEGPGQGTALSEEGLVMTYRWEEPVGTVIDYLEKIGCPDTQDLTLIGLSLGGYLSPRAAAYEPRIRRVVSWGVMFDFFQVVVSRRGPFVEKLIKVLLNLKLDFLLNLIVRRKMKKDPYMHWGVDHGMHVLGADSPAKYFRRLRNYCLGNCASLIRQDFLLLGSTEDHFVPLKDFYRGIRSMSEVRSLTSRLFTAEESAGDHCQFGNVELVLNTLLHWLQERKEAN